MRYAFENSETLVEPGTVPKSLRSKAPKFTEAPAGISLFPNPASEMLIVQYTVEETAQAMIYSADGRLVKEIPLSGRRPIHALDISDIAAGAYQLRIGNETGTFQVQR
jgi:DNA/RNA endonuclease YhcR with UshA esterase domain